MSAGEIREELRGFPPGLVDAALRYQCDRSASALLDMLPGMIAYHLPRGVPAPPNPLGDGLRLSQDLGMDSLSMMEMAFMLDELTGVSIESGEVKGVATVGDLKAFLVRKLQHASA